MPPREMTRLEMAGFIFIFEEYSSCLIIDASRDVKQQRDRMEYARA